MHVDISGFFYYTDLYLYIDTKSIKKNYSKVPLTDVTLKRENRLIKNTYFWCIYI